MTSPIAFGAVIYAKDVARLAAFYVAVAGLKEVHHEMTHAILEREGLQLVIHAIPAHIASSIEIATPPQRREETPIKLVFVVRSISEARTAASSLGGELNSRERQWVFQGAQVCDGHDPEGNVFQLREYAGA